MYNHKTFSKICCESVAEQPCGATHMALMFWYDAEEIVVSCSFIPIMVIPINKLLQPPKSVYP